MHRALIVLLACFALVPVPVATAGTATAHAACKRSTVLGKSKCLQRGQYCTHTSQAERDYRRAGFSCSKRDRNGRYHLQ
ncbi:MAG TPA: hypothetical protein VNS09_01070 [Solirubrobacter sp.]|nr:hypothetical protein [Solirubrobacter sp.]